MELLAVIGMCVGVVASCLLWLYFRFFLNWKGPRGPIVILGATFYVFLVLVGAIMSSRFFEWFGILGKLDRDQRLSYTIFWLVPIALTVGVSIFQAQKHKAATPLIDNLEIFLNKQWLPNSLVILSAAVNLVFLVLFFYLRITLGANISAVLLVGNLWLWFGLLTIAVLYFYNSKQPPDMREIRESNKGLLRNLFLIYGAVCIVALLWSVWVLS